MKVGILALGGLTVSAWAISNGPILKDARVPVSAPAQISRVRTSRTVQASVPVQTISGSDSTADTSDLVAAVRGYHELLDERLNLEILASAYDRIHNHNVVNNIDDTKIALATQQVRRNEERVEQRFQIAREDGEAALKKFIEALPQGELQQRLRKIAALDNDYERFEALRTEFNVAIKVPDEITFPEETKFLDDRYLDATPVEAEELFKEFAPKDLPKQRGTESASAYAKLVEIVGKYFTELDLMMGLSGIQSRIDHDHHINTNKKFEDERTAKGKFKIGRHIELLDESIEKSIGKGGAVLKSLISMLQTACPY